MAVNVIGLTGLNTGTIGSLDAYFVEGQGENYPAVTDKMVAISFVQGDAVYHHIADADSRADEDFPRIIKPLFLSSGVPYVGNLRWILHKVAPLIEDGENEGDIVRWNAANKAWESCALVNEFDQINFNPLATPGEDVEGGVFYKGTDKSIYVCTDDE